MARNDPQFNVRMPPELKDSLVEMAEKRNRSINAEIISAIQSAVTTYRAMSVYGDDFYDAFVTRHEEFDQKTTLRNIENQLKELSEKFDKLKS